MGPLLAGVFLPWLAAMSTDFPLLACLLGPLLYMWSALLGTSSTGMIGTTLKLGMHAGHGLLVLPGSCRYRPQAKCSLLSMIFYALLQNACSCGIPCYSVFIAQFRSAYTQCGCSPGGLLPAPSAELFNQARGLLSCTAL